MVSHTSISLFCLALYNYHTRWFVTLGKAALETFKTHWPNHLSITSFYEAYWAQLLTFQLFPRVWVSFMLNPDTLRLS